ncbi:hypothetical protein Csa_015645 [Cucumis sativus]|uniref:Uncharacterized protein n=1 Tax=Cucumis sativus TaxID=3659 RepID=A0A0A0K3W3_CUCSA|nr:hypothetical protein Csa_015645 [Cucumis sativus]
MDNKADHRAPRPNDRNNHNNNHNHNHHHHHKMAFTDLNLEDLKQNPRILVSPSPPSSIAARTPSSAKANCLCSPTTHIGSFRCRHHRHSGMIRGGSVGSNLSDLTRKPTEIVGSFSP